VGPATRRTVAPGCPATPVPTDTTPPLFDDDPLLHILRMERTFVPSGLSEGVRGTLPWAQGPAVPLDWPESMHIVRRVVSTGWAAACPPRAARQEHGGKKQHGQERCPRLGSGDGAGRSEHPLGGVGEAEREAHEIEHLGDRLREQEEGPAQVVDHVP